jgi:hypothetical protein
MSATAVHRRWISRRPGTRPRDVSAGVSVHFTPHESAGCLCSASHVAPPVRGDAAAAPEDARGAVPFHRRNGMAGHTRAEGACAQRWTVVFCARQPAVPRQNRVPPRTVDVSARAAASPASMFRLLWEIITAVVSEFPVGGPPHDREPGPPSAALHRPAEASAADRAAGPGVSGWCCRAYGRRGRVAEPLRRPAPLGRCPGSPVGGPGRSDACGRPMPDAPRGLTHRMPLVSRPHSRQVE